MNNRGYALVVSVLIFSTVLMLIGASATLNLIRSREQDTGAEAWTTAEWLAEGCAETALQALREDASYAGNETVTVGSQTCTIRPLNAGVPTTIETEATVNSRPYRIRILVDPSTFDITSWEHVVSF